MIRYLSNMGNSVKKHLIWLLLVAVIMPFSVIKGADEIARESASEKGCCVLPEMPMEMETKAFPMRPIL